jgi:hypothetical protein
MAILWMFEGPEVDERLFRALPDLGIDGTNVAGTAPSAEHRRFGIPFYVDHVAGKGVLSLREESWTDIRSRFIEKWSPEFLERPFCLDDPSSIERMRQRLRQVTLAAEANHPFAYALDDEVSLTRNESPFDFCFCRETLTRFRDHLRKKYGTIAKLNEVWSTAFADWSDVRPTTTQEIRRREFLKDPLRWNFAPWSDHREFMEQGFTDTVKKLVADVRRCDPGVPTGFTGGGSPTPFSGIVWSDLTRFCDFLEPYDIGGSRELVRSFAPNSTVIFRTLFPDADARFSRHEIWDYFLRGDRGVIIWSAAAFFSEKDVARPTEIAKALAPTFKEMDQPAIGRYLAAEEIPATVAVMESQPSNRMHWMLDSKSDGQAWIHRLASYEIEHSSQNLVRETWQKVLEDLHVPYEHVTPESLDAGFRKKYKVLILPRTIALSEKHAREIAAFAERGMVIADCQTGLFDENLVVRKTPVLDAVFGIERKNRLINLDEIRSTGKVDVDHRDLRLAEPGVAALPGIPSQLLIADRNAMIANPRPGGGRSVYLNLLAIDYLNDRLRRAEDHELLAETRGLLRSAGVETIADVRFPNDDPIPVRLHARRDGKTIYLGICANWRTSTQKVDRAALLDRKDPKIEILLHRAGIVADAMTGEPMSLQKNGAAAHVSSIVTTLPIFGGRHFAITEDEK